MESRKAPAVFQALLVVAVGTALGAGVNAVSRHPTTLLAPVYPTSASGPAACGSSPGAAAARVGTITQADAVVACGACTAAFVDARGAEDYAHGHLPGALHLPPVGHDQELSVVEPLRAYDTVVVYDEGAGCALARGVAERLLSMGLHDVRVLEGGWTQWQASGSAAESGACTQCEGPGR